MGWDGRGGVYLDSRVFVERHIEAFPAILGKLRVNLVFDRLLIFSWGLAEFGGGGQISRPLNQVDVASIDMTLVACHGATWLCRADAGLDDLPWWEGEGGKRGDEQDWEELQVFAET